jgi:DNA modification methylase
MKTNTIYLGDCLEILHQLPSESVDCIVTSPPYWGLRDYSCSEKNCKHKWNGDTCMQCGAWKTQLGHEPSPERYVEHLVAIFREAKRILKETGTCWLNLGDTYWRSTRTSPSGSQKQHRNRGSHATIPQPTPHPSLKQKDLVGIPWMVAFALRKDGWYLRSDIIWHKTNPMPESVKDRPTKSHEYVFLLTKNKRYSYDAEAISTPVTDSTIKRLSQPNRCKQKGSQRAHGGTKNMKPVVGSCHGRPRRNKRSVWTVANSSFHEAHYAVFPPKLIEPCILAGCPEHGIVLDPFMGSGTTALVALNNNRKYIGIERNPDYKAIAERRIHSTRNGYSVQHT